MRDGEKTVMGHIRDEFWYGMDKKTDSEDSDGASSKTCCVKKGKARRRAQREGWV